MQVAEKPKTVCVECKWLEYGVCFATLREIVYSTITGKPETQGVSVPGIKNDGNCNDYEEKT